MADWSAAQYLRFEKERTQPSVDLANRIGCENPKRILDIGCGPGNSTRVLKDRYPDARILGVDFSPNMVARAANDHPDIEFQVCDATKDLPALGTGYDIVFSNACIQWVPDHHKLLPAMMERLKPGGWLAVQTPINETEPISQIILDTAQSDKWQAHFNEPRHFYNLPQAAYYDLLSGLCRTAELWETRYVHILQSHRDIVEWYKGTGLRPYLDALSPANALEFEQDIYNGVTRAYPLQADGNVLFRFRRFFFTAVK